MTKLGLSFSGISYFFKFIDFKLIRHTLLEGSYIPGIDSSILISNLGLLLIL